MKAKLAGAGILALGLVLGALPGTGSDAQAAGGCGPGFHPNFRGFCRPNFGPRPFFGPRAFGPRPFYGRPGWRHGWHHGWRRW